MGGNSVLDWRWGILIKIKNIAVIQDLGFKVTLSPWHLVLPGSPLAQTPVAEFAIIFVSSPVFSQIDDLHMVF
jgi:hypothetical protein